MDPDPDYLPHVLGRRGEALAAEYLREKGWTLVARNYRFGRREVDIIMRREGILVFVEVKTRGGEGFGAPEAAITRLKRREIEIVAQHFLVHRDPGDVDVRFDAVSVRGIDSKGGPRVDHIEDAWRPGWP